jgi:hypothetical protein
MKWDEHRCVVSDAGSPASPVQQDPPNFHTRRAKIQQQADRDACCLQIIQTLREMGLSEGGYTLQFNQKIFFDKNVGKKIADDDAIVYHGNWQLLRYR